LELETKNGLVASPFFFKTEIILPDEMTTGGEK
jgi:hypothetical protein